MGRRAASGTGTWLAVIASACLVAAPGVAAQQASSYDALIEEGLTEFGLGHWNEAYTLFKRAHEGSPNARTLRGMGMTSYELQKYPRALEQLTAALHSAVKPLDEGQQTQVRELIERSSRLVGTLELTVSPPGAEVLVNDYATTERQVVVPVGTTTVRATLSGHQSEKRVLEVDGGQRYEVELALTPTNRVGAGGVAPSPVPTTAGEPATRAPGAERQLDLKLDDTQPPQVGDDGVLGSPWLWAGVGVAVVGGILAAIVLAPEDTRGGESLGESNIGISVKALGGAARPGRGSLPPSSSRLHPFR